MAYHPINLALRFLLEIAALISLGYWGWSQHQGALRPILGIGLPVVAGAVWGIFRVPGDASASGEAPVPVRGPLRLLLELVLFALAVWALYASGKPGWGLGLAIATALHYLASYDRVVWLIRNQALDE
jgi:hypothetical protein